MLLGTEPDIENGGPWKEKNKEAVQDFCATFPRQPLVFAIGADSASNLLVCHLNLQYNPYRVVTQQYQGPQEILSPGIDFMM